MFRKIYDIYIYIYIYKIKKCPFEIWQKSVGQASSWILNVNLNSGYWKVKCESAIYWLWFLPNENKQIKTFLLFSWDSYMVFVYKSNVLYNILSLQKPFIIIITVQEIPTHVTFFFFFFFEGREEEIWQGDREVLHSFGEALKPVFKKERATFAGGNLNVHLLI